MGTKEKLPRKRQYELILDSSYDANFDDCSILEFEFREMTGSGQFHYALMRECRGKYYIFDGLPFRAQVVFKTDEKVAERIKKIAAKLGGVEGSPWLD